VNGDQGETSALKESECFEFLKKALQGEAESESRLDRLEREVNKLKKKIVA
jgi:tRNA(Ser,Leu) C12 N-acetylase TAN1